MKLKISNSVAASNGNVLLIATFCSLFFLSLLFIFSRAVTQKSVSPHVHCADKILFGVKLSL